MTPPLSPTRGRLLIVAASVLWSLSGAFTCFLTEPTFLGLDNPRLAPLQIAAARVFFSGLSLTFLLRRGDVLFRPSLLVNGTIFAVMNACFITAMAIGSKATAILLQYTAPLWLYLVSAYVLREKPHPRGAVALAVGMAGIAVIVYGGWEGESLLAVTLGLLSGVTFAGILLGLRAQEDVSPVWVNASTHLMAAAALVPFVAHLPPPTPAQLGWLALFGSVQLGLPYLLVTKGVRVVSPQEAGTLSLLEPVLNPVWAFLVSPEKERPTAYVLAGGLLILAALAYRYWPTRPAAPEPPA